MTTPWNSETAVVFAGQTQLAPRVSQISVQAAYGPSQAGFGTAGQASLLLAEAGHENVQPNVSQLALLIAFTSATPNPNRTPAWTFVLDGHRFYVLPLGAEGDWAYDTTTQQWCQLQTQGFEGINFSNGVMWDFRIMGGDTIYTTLYEMDPEQPLDEGWREIEHSVTGHLPTRNVNFSSIGSFRLTATSGIQQADDAVINLRFSDDNGNTWSEYYPITLQAGNYSQLLVWSGLGSFRAPGRLFEVSDSAGLIAIYGADAHYTGSEILDQADQDDN